MVLKQTQAAAFTLPCLAVHLCMYVFKMIQLIFRVTTINKPYLTEKWASHCGINFVVGSTKLVD